ncbi:gamma-glutamyl-gamma-aminobutyrate hydrolase family protein [uncultured Helicobacter sp.]|uniref:gamma-glutamyl-gamma-aminobutyrate hydrolase family protein n=1 Tax=uncultured Helicobacter sp. TaxID=175537 RepID=UPI00374E839B
MRLGITQRVYYHEPYGECWECLDSKLYAFLGECGFDSFGLSYTQEVDRILSICDGIVLSGGNDIGEYAQRDTFEQALIESALRAGKKILGICRGMQMIARYFGVELRESSHKIGQIHRLQGGLSHNVTSFHHYTLAALPQGFRTLASVGDEIEAMENGEILGIMWHPEREECQETREADKHLITNFFIGA